MGCSIENRGICPTFKFHEFGPLKKPEIDPAFSQRQPGGGRGAEGHKRPGLRADPPLHCHAGHLRSEVSPQLGFVLRKVCWNPADPTSGARWRRRGLPAALAGLAQVRVRRRPPPLVIQQAGIARVVQIDPLRAQRPRAQRRGTSVWSEVAGRRRRRRLPPLAPGSRAPAAAIGQLPGRLSARQDVCVRRRGRFPWAPQHRPRHRRAAAARPLAPPAVSVLLPGLAQVWHTSPGLQRRAVAPCAAEGERPGLPREGGTVAVSRCQNILCSAVRARFPAAGTAWGRARRTSPLPAVVDAVSRVRAHTVPAPRVERDLAATTVLTVQLKIEERMAVRTAPHLHAARIPPGRRKCRRCALLLSHRYPGTRVRSVRYG